MNILCHGRTVDIAEAVEAANTPDFTYGELEQMKARSDLQDKMMARMLGVMFGEYEDHFSETRYHPKTNAEKLSFILGSDHMVTEV